MIFLLFVFALFTTSPNLSIAEETEGVMSVLLAPGPLIKAHQSLEGPKDCFKCHDVGKGTPDRLCLDCHKEIKPFVIQKKGYHGLTKQSCRECHDDHKGRNFNSIELNDKEFNHKFETGFDLTGKHEKLKCNECHKEKHGNKSARSGLIRYFGRQSTCVSCHKKEDIHFFKGEFAKKDCGSCHGVKTWKDEIQFNHEKDGHYKLVGKHEKLKCAECHGISKKQTTPLYAWPQLKTKECLSCHTDYHKNNLSPKYQGGKCTQCHDQHQNTWKILQFDHDVTGFKLRDKHAEIKCLDCHKQKSFTSVSAASSQLIGTNQQGEANLSQGNLVSQIGNINLPLKVDNSLSHYKDFNFKGLKSACISCHQDIHKFGPHKNQKYGKFENACSTCHNERNWKLIFQFEHNSDTRYKLDGKHLDVKCAACHKTEVKTQKSAQYHWPQLTQKGCVNCHANPHTKEFSKEFARKTCTECHVTSSWKEILTDKNKHQKVFDHDKTRFPLKSAHQMITCINCHGVRPNQVYKFKTPQTQFCIDCHTNIHTKQFSPTYATNDCLSCHTQKNFTERLDFDHEKTRYPLHGAHSKVKCDDCHKPENIKKEMPVFNYNSKAFPDGLSFTPKRYLMPEVNKDTCKTCHADVHSGQLDNKCMSCHTFDAWKIQKFDHTSKTKYELLGKHQKVKCDECHKQIPFKYVDEFKKKIPVIKYKPISQSCNECHKDVHRGEYGNRCQECHHEKDWKWTRDFHKNFTLQGVHHSLECSDCHKDGKKLSGLSRKCHMCHAKDDIHSETSPNCLDCHTQHYWEVSSFKHSMTQFPLRGAHRVIECMECHRNGTYKGLSTQCSTCHVNDAMKATSKAHTPISNFMDCAKCHKSHFSF